MSLGLTCPECSGELPADAPRGLCPACLVAAAAGLAGGRVEPATSTALRIRYFGDYELQGEIARGGMGVVYRARQVSLNRPVAIKMILAGFLANEADVKRFRAEAEVVAGLDHPNIVEIFEVGEHDGQHYFSMKLVEGLSLAQQRAQADRPMEIRPAARLVATAARAVHYAHQRGVLHRDIKPGNILVDRAGEPHITDFGVAKRVAIESDLTCSGTVLGSPAFMSPEQAAGKPGQLTTATDIFSLGAVLYLLLTGRPPFSGATSWETLRAVTEQEPASPRHLNPRVDRDLENICLTCLRKDPEARYRSADALADDLERWQRGEPVRARPVSTAEGVIKWVRRRPAMAALLLLTVASVTIAMAGITWAWRRSLRAEAATTQELRRTYLEQARANRLTFRAGRRFDSLEHLAKAAAIRPAMDLRDEVIACLALSDTRVLRTNAIEAGSTVAALPDDTFARYAIDLPAGEISIRDAVDDHELSRLPAVGARVVGIESFSHGGRWLLAQYDDGKLRVWNIQQWQVTLVAPASGLSQCADFRKDDQCVAVANPADEIRVNDPNTGRRLRTWHLPFSPTRVAYSSDGRLLAVSGSGTTVLVLDGDTGEIRSRLEHLAELTALAWHPDSRRLATTSYDRLVRIWESTTGRLLHTLAGHGQEVHGITFHPGGEWLLSAGYTGTMLWNVATGQRDLILPQPGCRLKFSPDGNIFAGKTFDRSGLFWGDLALDSVVRAWGSREPEHQERAIAYSPGGRYLASCDSETLRCLAASTGRELARLDQRGVKWVGFDEGENLWTAGSNGVMRWPGHPGAQAGTWELGPGARVDQLDGLTLQTISPGGRFLAALKPDSCRLFQVNPWRSLAARPLQGKLDYCAVHPAGKWVTLGTWHGDWVVVLCADTNPPSLPVVARLTEPAAYCGNSVFSPDGSRLAVNWGRAVSLYDTANWKRLWRQTGVEGSTLAFSSCGGLIAVPDPKRRIQLLNALDGSVQATLEIPNGMGVRDVAFSSVGANLAVANEATREMFQWDLAGIRSELSRMGLDWPGKAWGRPATAEAVEIRQLKFNGE